LSQSWVKLSNSFRGCTLYFRNIDPILRRKRNTDIRKDYDSGGVRVKDIAIKYKLSKRQIENILSSLD
jgi:Mor family transcriptional regulator